MGKRKSYRRGHIAALHRAQTVADIALRQWHIDADTTRANGAQQAEYARGGFVACQMIRDVIAAMYCDATGGE